MGPVKKSERGSQEPEAHLTDRYYKANWNKRHQVKKQIAPQYGREAMAWLWLEEQLDP